MERKLWVLVCRVWMVFVIVVWVVNMIIGIVGDCCCVLCRMVKLFICGMLGLVRWVFVMYRLNFLLCSWVIVLVLLNVSMVW